MAPPRGRVLQRGRGQVSSSLDRTENTDSRMDESLLHLSDYVDKLSTVFVSPIHVADIQALLLI